MLTDDMTHSMTGSISQMSRSSDLTPLPPGKFIRDGRPLSSASRDGNPSASERRAPESGGVCAGNAELTPPIIPSASERRAPESGGVCAGNAELTPPMIPSSSERGALGPRSMRSGYIDLTPPRVSSASLRGHWKSRGRFSGARGRGTRGPFAPDALTGGGGRMVLGTGRGEEEDILMQIDFSSDERERR